MEAELKAHRKPGTAPMGSLGDQVLGTLEKMDHAYAAWDMQRKELERLYARVVSAYIFPGAVIDMQTRSRSPLCLVNFNVDAGASRGAHLFEVTSEPRVHLTHDGHPTLTKWFVKAAPISKSTGKVISGRTHGANSTDDYVTLSGYVFFDVSQFGPEIHEGPVHDAQQCRKAFIEFAAQAEAALAEREQNGASPDNVDDTIASEKLNC